jgi:VanZ family protein
MKNLIYRAATIIYMAALIVVSIQPVLKGHGSDISRQIFNNMLHIPAYGLLTFLLIKSFSKVRYVYIASFLFAVAFGVFNEYLQSFVPGRYASGYDVLLNGLGSLIVVSSNYFKIGIRNYEE